MTGSLKDFKYFDDENNPWSIEADESNMEAVHVDAAAADITPTDLTTHQFQLPRNLKARVARFASSSTASVRVVPIISTAVLSSLKSGDGTAGNRSFTDNGETFNYIGFTPEKVTHVIKAGDTGLTDGDDT